jgi:hypothetical protein
MNAIARKLTITTSTLITIPATVETEFLFFIAETIRQPLDMGILDQIVATADPRNLAPPNLAAYRGAPCPRFKL